MRDLAARGLLDAIEELTVDELDPVYDMGDIDDEVFDQVFDEVEAAAAQLLAEFRIYLLQVATGLR